MKLNLYIYKDIEFYLLYNNSFNRLLELSLLCKQSFKRVQYLISFHQKLINFYIPINQLIKYITLNNFNKNNENGNESNYQLKLIQFKNIEIIHTNSIIEKKEFIKNKLKILCPLLKIVSFKKYNIKGGHNSSRDFTYDGFYQYKKISIKWNLEYPPISNGNEFDELFLNQDLQNYQYSFDFLKQYGHIKKLIISTDFNNQTKLSIENLSNLLIKCPTINNYKFINQYTPYQFLYKLLLNENNIKKLSIRLSLNNNNNNNNLFEILNLKLNSNLKKLKLFNSLNNFKKNNDNDLNNFLISLIGNKSLNILGLQLFNIKNNINNNYNNILKLLKEIPTINKLYCNYYSIKSFLIHCNENSNIKNLVISNDPLFISSSSTIINLNKDKIIKLFESFFKENKSLKYLTIIDHSKLNSNIKSFENFIQFKFKLINLLKDSNNKLLILNFFEKR